MKNNQGMTLVEVVIAILLVTFIAIYCGNLIRQNYNLKKFIETTGDHYTLGPAIISLIKKDYIQTYSPHILPKQFFRQSITFDNPNYDANAPATPNLPSGTDASNPNPTPPGSPNNEPTITLDLKGTELPTFHLIGTADSINFISLSHRRFYRNQKESSIHEVYYGTQNGENGLLKIIKRTNVNVENKLTLKEGLGQEIQPEEIYDRVSSLKFEYCEAKKLSCDTKWDSEKMDGDKKYPDYIKVTLALKPMERDIVSFGILSSFLDLNYLPKNFQEKQNQKNQIAGENELPGAGDDDGNAGADDQ